MHWAEKECEADIISISSGFTQGHMGLRDAIKKVVGQDVLVFAAASNYGNIRRLTFPAKMRERVFRIYSTDGRGNVANQSSSFNPPALPDSKSNFAILGEDIMLNSADPQNLLTGTSYATSIAAGLAARLLEFSNQRIPKTTIRKRDLLRSFEGMTAVFQELIGNTASVEYQCLRPWRFIEDAAEGETRDVMRQRVCEIISLALEKVD